MYVPHRDFSGSSAPGVLLHPAGVLSVFGAARRRLTCYRARLACPDWARLPVTLGPGVTGCCYTRWGGADVRGGAAGRGPGGRDRPPCGGGRVGPVRGRTGRAGGVGGLDRGHHAAAGVAGHSAGRTGPVDLARRCGRSRSPGWTSWPGCDHWTQDQAARQALSAGRRAVALRLDHKPTGRGSLRRRCRSVWSLGRTTTLSAGPGSGIARTGRCPWKARAVQAIVRPGPELRYGDGADRGRGVVPALQRNRYRASAWTADSAVATASAHPTASGRIMVRTHVRYPGRMAGGMSRRRVHRPSLHERIHGTPPPTGEAHPAIKPCWITDRHGRRPARSWSGGAPRLAGRARQPASVHPSRKVDEGAQTRPHAEPSASSLRSRVGHGLDGTRTSWGCADSRRRSLACGLRRTTPIQDVRTDQAGAGWTKALTSALMVWTSPDPAGLGRHTVRYSGSRSG